MSKEKILLLGGSYAQLPAIKKAKEQGLYVILCDYLPDNPGRELADEYHNVSTTDKKGVLKLARSLNIDYILAYASDPAAPTAAYVAEEMGLPGNSYKSVKVLSEKNLFRKLLQENEIPVPNWFSLNKSEISSTENLELTFPLIVKPVDSSGSKGVSKIKKISEFPEASTYALNFSRRKRIIVEEFINSSKGDIHGDGFVKNGELVFTYLGDHIYNDDVNPYNPIGTTWPSEKPKSYIEKIESLVQKIITGSGFQNGPINIEAKIDDSGQVYIMEVGARSGGHFVPQAIEYGTGFDMVKGDLKIKTGKDFDIIVKKEKCVAYYALHSENNGKLLNVELSEKLYPYIKDFHQYIEQGEEVKSFQGANAAIGILLMKFDNRSEMNQVMNSIEEFITVEVI